MDASVEREYDVCLSFAGEERPYVRQVADTLEELGLRVFYDDYEQVILWGKDLYAHLDYVYGRAARYCVLFASDAYARKVWTNHERQSAQARALNENVEYLLPVRFDDTYIPGLKSTVGYVDARLTEPEQLATLILNKVESATIPRSLYFPPRPDRLEEYFTQEDPRALEVARVRAYAFFKALTRMTEVERRLVLLLFREACVHGLPENAHVSIDLVRRVTGQSSAEILEIGSGLKALGFNFWIEEGADHPGAPKDPDDDLLKIFMVWIHGYSKPYGGNATEEAYAVVKLARYGLCDECGDSALQRLDFSQLASKTAIREG